MQEAKGRGWGIVAAYGAVAAITQTLWLTYAPITTETAHRYGVSVSAIGWLSEIFPLLYVVLAIPAGALLDLSVSAVARPPPAGSWPREVRCGWGAIASLSRSPARRLSQSLSRS